MDDRFRQARNTPDASGLTRRDLSGLLLAGAAGACSPVGTFNLIAGRDAQGVLAVEGEVFDAARNLRLDIYQPAGLPAENRRPVVLFIYGGSWANGARGEYGFAGSTLAAMGYVTVIADYRKRPEVLFPAFLEDGARALGWIERSIARHGGDRRRIALVGHSAGAYNAVMLALDRRYLRASGIDAAAIKAVAGLAGPYDFFPWDSPTTRATFDAWPSPQDTQPVRFARRDAPPIFLATGTADTTVRPSNTRALAAALRRTGASVTEKHYDSVDHAGILTGLSPLLRDRNPVLADLRAFLAARLGNS